NRQIRLEQLQRQQAQQKRRKTAGIWGGIVLVVLAVGLVIWLFNRNKGDDSVAPSSSSVAPATTTPPPGTTAVPTPRPAADGSSPKTQTFTGPPAMCIDPTKTYTATVETNKGTFTVALDPTKAPNTVNNFVALAGYHCFDDTPCHRIIKDFVVQC